MRKIKQIVIHCTATKEGKDYTVKDVDRWHKERGWKGIGYHFLIRLDGDIEVGRPIEAIGAHVKNFNKESIGIVYVGGLDKNNKPKDTRTEAQKDALHGLLTYLKADFPFAKILGHRDFPDVKKDCPCFDAKTEYKCL